MRDATPADLVVELPRSIDPALAADIEKQSVYVSEDLLSLRVAAGLDAVTLVCREQADTAVVRDKVQRFLDAMLKRFRPIEPTVHHRRERAASAPPLQRRVFAQLVERGWAFEHGQGVVSLHGTALALMEGLDAALAADYRQRFGAVPHSYPATIKASVLARCDYFEMHPNALSFVSHLVNDLDEIEAFRQANAGQPQLKLTHPRAFAPVHQCLNPAACFPCYENLEGSTLPPEGMVLTWKGRVFRYESSNTVGLDRLQEFNVRELVFLGTDGFVREGRRRAAELTRELMERWDLGGRIETATDPFFATVYAARTFWQESMEVKYELCLDIEPGDAGQPRTIAAGSLNLHGAFFGDRFFIRDHTGEAAYTGCVGWGLERWVLAVFTQHGMDTARWPAALRALV